MAGAPRPIHPLGRPGHVQQLLDHLASVPAADLQQWRNYFLGEAQAMDPRSKEGLLNLMSMALPVGGRFAPRTPGLKAEIAQRGDAQRNYLGEYVPHRPSGNAKGVPNTRSYNLRNQSGDIVASAQTRRFAPQTGRRREVFVDSMFVDPKFRTSGAGMDLFNLITHGGKLKPSGVVRNDRLYKIMQRRLERGR